MNDRWLATALKESKNLVDTVLEDNAPVLMKALLTARVFELKTSGGMNVLASQGDAPEETRMSLGNLEVNELVRIVKPKSHIEWVTAFGFYLASRSTDRFGNTEILTLYGKCKKKPPKNLPDAISKAVSRGYLIEVGIEGKRGSRMVSLTSTGRDFVLSKVSDTNGP